MKIIPNDPKDESLAKTVEAMMNSDPKMALAEKYIQDICVAVTALDSLFGIKVNFSIDEAQ